MANDSVSVFISYSHADEQYRRELGIALASLRDEEKVSEWHDRRIQGGEEWDEAIKRELNKADIILLLLSADFIASDYIRKNEIPAAIERHQSGEAIVIPVFLRRFDYSPNASYAKLQGYPTNALPVDLWPNKDEAYFTVVRGIREVVERVLEERKQKGAKLEAARQLYRTKAKEQFADGSICTAERDTLDELRVELGLSQADAEQIEREEGAPDTKKDAARDKYRNTLLKIVEEAFPIRDKHRESLDGRMRDLGLNAEDVANLEAEVFAQAKARQAAAQRQVGPVLTAEPKHSNPPRKLSNAPAPPKGTSDAALAWTEAVAVVRKGGSRAIELSASGCSVSNNPSEHQIRAVLEEIRATDVEPFACLGKDLTYVQAYRGESDWAAEFQNGAIDQHFEAGKLELEQVVQLFVSFRNGEQGWPESITFTRMKL